MNRIVMPWLVAMAVTSSAHAKSVLSAYSDWEGVYVGFTVDSFGDNTFDFETTPFLTGDIDGRQWGSFIGYRRQFGDFVIGGEFDASVGDTDTTLSVPLIAFEDSFGTRTSLRRLGVEAGYSFGRFLPYATAGLATLTFQETAEDDNRGIGQFYGLGLDVQTGEYVSIGIEALRHNIDNFSEIDDFSVEATTFGLNFAVRY